MGRPFLYQPEQKELAMISELMQIEIEALRDAGYSREEAYEEAFHAYGFEWED